MEAILKTHQAISCRRWTSVADLRLQRKVVALRKAVAPSIRPSVSGFAGEEPKKHLIPPQRPGQRLFHKSPGSTSLTHARPAEK